MDWIDYDRGMSEIEELRLDAERYRWLRAHPVGVGMRDAPTWFEGENLDKMIDHASHSAPESDGEGR